MAEFPVTYQNQEEFDQAISGRINRERDKLKKESGNDQELESAQSRVAELEGEIQRRDAKAVLQEMAVDPGRHDKILKLADMPEDGDQGKMRQAFKDLHGEMPEVFGENAQVKDTGLDTSGGGDDGSGPLTEEQVRSMSPDQINSNWDRVKAFVSGER